MFEVTRAAAKQIRESAERSDMAEFALRIVADTDAQGAIHYKMGFDEIAEGDTLIACKGVDVLIRNRDKELLQGATLDYVELHEGHFEFIFLNPNDPHCRAPTE